MPSIYQFVRLASLEDPVHIIWTSAVVLRVEERRVDPLRLREQMPQTASLIPSLRRTTRHASAFLKLPPTAKGARATATTLLAPHYSTSRASIGGRAWPSFILGQPQWETVVTLWFNSSFGLLTFWWNASKAQHGRGSVTTTRLGTLECVDPRRLDAAQLAAAERFFNSFKGQPLQDIHECADDPVRAELDRFVVDTLLSPTNREVTLDGIHVLRAKLAAEPSISG